MSWFVDLHDLSLQRTQNIYRVAWFRIKMNYKESNEYNTNFVSVKKYTKNKLKTSYFIPSSQPQT